MKIGDKEIRPHFLRDGVCEKNRGFLIWGSKVLAQQFADQYLGGKRATFEERCPHCGELATVVVKLTSGRGAVIWGCL